MQTEPADETTHRPGRAAPAAPDGGMSTETRRMAGILLALFPTVVFGGVSLLSHIVFDDAYMDNPLRQGLWRAGHAHAGVLLILSLVALRYVDDASLSRRTKMFVRNAIPATAILLPLAFFLSVVHPDATEPGPIIYLAYVGAVLLTVAMATLGVGLLRKPAGS